MIDVSDGYYTPTLLQNKTATTGRGFYGRKQGVNEWGNDISRKLIVNYHITEPLKA